MFLKIILKNNVLINILLWLIEVINLFFNKIQNLNKF